MNRKPTLLLKHITTHNLKNISVAIPHRTITVVTGVSGSGKSSLAIDTLYAEGQRRYIESLSPYTRQFLERMERPAVEQASGILPAICIEAQNVITNARSTVGTQTEINDFLRILFTHCGRYSCPACGTDVTIDYSDRVATMLIEQYPDQPAAIVFSIPFADRSKKQAAFFIDELVLQGYVRIVQDGVVSDLANTAAIQELIRKEGSLAVVLDRLALSKRSRSRLIDSLATAYERGRNYCSVIVFSDTSFTRVTARHSFSLSFSCAQCKKEFKKPEPNLFSFNSPIGACPECEGFGRIIVIDRDLIVPDTRRSLADGAIEPWEKPSAQWEKKQLLAFCTRNAIPTNIPFSKLSKQQQKYIFSGKKADDYFSVDDFFSYLERKTYKMHVRVFLSRYRNYVPCPVCRGSRLTADALRSTVRGKTIYDLQRMRIRELRSFLGNLALPAYEKKIVGAALGELISRVEYLDDVGLGYLTLDRMSRTLSGGEMQRINLATALGTQLVDTLYVLDEPSIGLHERDTQRLIGILKDFKALGNTVVVIEHDVNIMRIADTIIDLGPRAGTAGGSVVACGSLATVRRTKGSATGRYLRGESSIQFSHRNKNRPATQWLKIIGAREHNLKNISAAIPLERFVVVTGVSGSGKSTLVYDVLYRNYCRHKGEPVSDVGAVQKITGFDAISGCIFVDQSALGRSIRSCALTYAGVYGDVRKLFAETREARQSGITMKHFSFNVEGGRCEKCQGIGKIKEEMHFLADVYLECETCRGKRFSKEVLAVTWHGKTIDDIFSMTVTEAVDFFSECPGIVKKLSIFNEVGLGYLTLGQSTVSLSAGEAQRMKLAVEMVEKKKKKQLFIFDEPTIGLHYEDIAVLMRAFEKLLENGHSIIIIEHNMEVIRCADYVIDLGPDGGDKGGEVICMGSPQNLMKEKRSITGTFLKSFNGKRGNY